MKNTTSNSNKTKRSSHTLRNIAIISACCIGHLLILPVLALAGITIYLTPERLTRLVNKEGSKYLYANVKASNVDYTLWSTFPRLCISADSVRIVSRTLDSLPDSISSRLPENASSLASTGRVSASVNILKAIKGEIGLSGVRIANPTVNLVAFNNNINNFSIIPSSFKIKKMPRISADTIVIGRPITVDYFNASAPCDVAVNITDALIARQPDKGSADTYRVRIAANAGGSFSGYSLPGDIPLAMNGIIGLDFDPLSIRLSDYSLDLPGLHSVADMEMQAEQDGKSLPSIRRLAVDINTPDISDLLKYIPENLTDKINNFSDFEGHLPLSANFILSAPYALDNFSGSNTRQDIPAFSLRAEVPEGELTLPLGGSKPLEISGIALKAIINIDPRTPLASLLNVERCRLVADGAELSLSAKATELFSGDPIINADISCKANLKKASTAFIPSKSVKIAGNLDGTTHVSCRLSLINKNPLNEINAKSIKDVNVKGEYRIASFYLADAASKLSARLSDLSVSLASHLPEISASSLSSANLSLTASAGHGNISTGDSVAASLHNASINARIYAAGKHSNPSVGGKATLIADSLATTSPGLHFSSQGVLLALNASMRHTPWSAPTKSFGQEASSSEDSIIMSRTPHTPLYLSPSLSGILPDILSLANIKADIEAKSGTLISDSYDAQNSFSDLHASTNLDSVYIESLRIKTGSTSASISGSVKGVREFLTSPSPALLVASLDADLDCVDINKLSGAYYRGQEKATGKPAVYEAPKPGAYTAADSLCILIPRNLAADIRLRSESAKYMDWEFSPLSTQIIIDNGVATLHNLTVGAPYCTAIVDWTYSTADLNDIFMQLHANVKNFEFRDFLTQFPSLSEENPQLANLSGSVSAEADGKFLMFPDMFLNVESMKGDVNIDGEDIEFKREGKIAGITHLMLIKGDNPLAVPSLKIHGSFHDNLLQVDPFTIKCGGYDLLVAGVNNLEGEMYYHLGLVHNPFHLPFGINIVGNYHHPGIRFGGSGVKDGREREISSSLESTADVNIMRQLKYGWLLFIENAAKYDHLNNHSYMSDVE